MVAHWSMALSTTTISTATSVSRVNASSISMRTYICAENWRIAPPTPDLFRPSADVYETNEGIVIRVELAGVRPEDIRVHAHGSKIQIEGVRRDREHHKHGFHLMEIAFGPFSTVVELPSPRDLAMERVSAWYTEGFLYVRAPFTRLRTVSITRIKE